MQPSWLEKIKQIPVVRKAGLLGCERMTGGTSNVNHKITTELGIWVVRINQNQPGVNRTQESLILKRLAPLEITPAVIEVNHEAGYLITQYTSKPAWRQITQVSESSVVELAHRLNQVHQIPYDYLPSRLDQRIISYLKHMPKVPSSLKLRLLQNIESLSQMKFWEACHSLYHSDLNPSNILGQTDPLIIDWEFAGQGHAVLDWLIMEHEHQIDFAAHYPADTEEKWLKPIKSLVADLMHLWTMKKQPTI